MDPDQAIKALDVYAEANVAAFLWGTPGTGKTSGVEAWAEARDCNIVVLIGSLMDPTEIGGIPMRDMHEPTYDFALPRWFHDIMTDTTEKGTIIFFDELNTAPPGTMAALLRLVQSRAIHAHKLPESAYIVCAGNDPMHMELADPLPSAMQSRLGHIAWSGWGARVIEKRIEGFPVPPCAADANAKNRIEAEARWGSIITQFLERRPQQIEDFEFNEGKVAKVGRGYPTQRSWDNLLTSLSYADRFNDHQLFRHITEGLIGEAPAIEFLSYAEELKLPSPESWLKDPSQTRDLGRDDKNVAILDAVVTAVDFEPTTKRWGAALTITATMGKLTSAGVGGSAAKKLATMVADKKVKIAKGMPELAEFTSFYHDVLVKIGAIPGEE